MAGKTAGLNQQGRGISQSFMPVNTGNARGGMSLPLRASSLIV